MRIQKLAHLFIILSLFVLVLILAQNLLIPIVLAVFIWFIIREIKQLLKKIGFVKRKVPSRRLRSCSFATMANPAPSGGGARL